MLLVISLIIVSLFIYFLKDSLKKHAGIYYIGAAVISIAVFLIGFLSMPLFVKNNILGIFAKGSLGTAMFVAVMYAGALPKGSKLIAPLMKIRGELSITAAILVLCHNFTYGMTYFKMLFIKPAALSATQLTAAIITDLRQQLRMQMEHIHSLQDRLEVESHLQSRISVKLLTLHLR